MKDCILWVGPHAGAGQKREEERETETKGNELTATSIPHPPVPLRQGAEGRGVRSEVEPGKKGGVRERVFSFVLISHHLPLLQLFGNKLN